MFQKIICGAAIAFSAASFGVVSAQQAKTPRVSAMYCTWDDYYFYAAFQVSDPKVTGTNSTPTSHPQADDDVELFINTDRGDSTVRTASTYQMAISSANGAYFSVGQGTAIPKPKVVYTYKYAATVDGTINDNSNTDLGYTVEVAIPWKELGRSGPPADGTVWGFNAISRNTDNQDSPAAELYSLSQKVRTASDVQNPSKWTTLLFTGKDAGGQTSSETKIVAPHVSRNIPEIDGKIVSGEWPAASMVSFGDIPLEIAAPTVADEPNVTEADFRNIGITPPPKPITAPLHRIGDTVAGTDQINLPGGGSIKIVPGGVKEPAGFNPTPVDSNGKRVNPLTARNNHPGPAPKSPVSLTGSLALTPPSAARLIFALYRIDYAPAEKTGLPSTFWGANGRALTADQPTGGAGPWVNGQDVHWHIEQLSSMRRAGVEAAMIRVYRNDVHLDAELDAVVAALRAMQSVGSDYPLLGIAVATSAVDLNAIYARIPPEFRAVSMAHPSDTPHVVVCKLGTDISLPGALADGTVIDSVEEGTSLSVIRPTSGAGETQKRISMADYAALWSSQLVNDADYILINSWNDFQAGTQVEPSNVLLDSYYLATKSAIETINSKHQWHAKYLWASVPRDLRTKQLYQVPVRILNAGTLPWKATQSYSLCTRWYKDGRLFEDSAPRIPIGRDVLPGQAVTLDVGVTPINGFGDDLEPGQYTLVVDMVQGNDSWFSYASDTPLQASVRVVASAVDEPVSRATFLGSTTPNVWRAGEALQTKITIRNDSTSPWPTNEQVLGYKIFAGSMGSDAVPIAEGSGAKFAADVQPGDVVTVPAVLGQTNAFANSDLTLHWFVRPLGEAKPVSGEYNEGVTQKQLGTVADVLLAQIPDKITPGKSIVAKIAIRNAGADVWSPQTNHVVAEWYDETGARITDAGQAATALPSSIQPGEVVPILKVKTTAPPAPGRYTLIFRVLSAGDLETLPSIIPPAQHTLRTSVVVIER